MAVIWVLLTTLQHHPDLSWMGYQYSTAQRASAWSIYGSKNDTQVATF